MRARLIIVRGEGNPQVCDLDPLRPVTLGRSRDNDVVLNDEHASRMHARVYFEQGGWFIKDLNTRNATRVNSQKIKGGEAPLFDGHEIAIAEMRLRFQAANGKPVTAKPPRQKTTPLPPQTDEAPIFSDTGHTTLEVDELAALHEFMTETVALAAPQAVLQRALTTVAVHSRASVVGYLSLDPDNPLPKLLYPERADYDCSLSRQLTRRAQETGAAVWLKAGVAGLEQSESLMPFHDAVCVPLAAEGAPLGALHAYKKDGFFSEREFRFCQVLAGYAASCLARLRQFRSLEAENSRLRAHAPVSDKIIGTSAALRDLDPLIGKAARSKATVLIHGETGAGKEMVALEIHRRSARHREPCVVVNCGAIAPGVLESELFGHAEGAFTGATCKHAGLFQQADGGTLFLDEIGEMTPDCQVKMLRVLEGKGFRPVGGSREIQPEVRVIAASHKDLQREVQTGKFRQDLYFRLRVVCITVPPLRDHKEDVPALVEHFLDRFVADCGRRKRISPEGLQRLMDYSWPGNVRELRTVLESAVVLSEGDVLGPHDFASLQDAPLPTDLPQSLNLEHVEAWAIRQALRKTGWNITRAAKILDISRETLATKIRKYGLRREDEPGQPDQPG